MYTERWKRRNIPIRDKSRNPYTPRDHLVVRFLSLYTRVTSFRSGCIATSPLSPVKLTVYAVPGRYKVVTRIDAYAGCTHIYLHTRYISSKNLSAKWITRLLPPPPGLGMCIRYGATGAGI